MSKTFGSCTITHGQVLQGKNCKSFIGHGQGRKGIHEVNQECQGYTNKS